MVSHSTLHIKKQTNETVACDNVNGTRNGFNWQLERNVK